MNMEPTAEHEKDTGYARDRGEDRERLGELAAGIRYRARVLSSGRASRETMDRLLCEVDQFVALGRRYLEDRGGTDPGGTG